MGGPEPVEGRRGFRLHVPEEAEEAKEAYEKPLTNPLLLLLLVLPLLLLSC